MPAAGLHCPHSSLLAWLVFFFHPLSPYPIHHLPSSSISSFCPAKYTFLQQLSAFLTGYPLHFPLYAQVKWLESMSHTGEKIHQILFQQCWKKLLGKSYSYPTVSERTLPWNHWLSSSRKFLLAHTNSCNVGIFKKSFLMKAEQPPLNFQSCALNHNEGTSSY